MACRYTQLDVFKEAKKIHQEVFQITDCLLPKARYIADQIRRAALSVALNIAEGAGKASAAEFARYVSNALGSINEVSAGLEIACELNFIAPEKINSVQQKSELLRKRLGALRRSLRNN